MQKTLTTRLGILFAALFAAIGFALVPQMAHAHDVLVESQPERGSTVETTPEEIRLQFSGEPLTGEGLNNLIRVTDEDGNQWEDGDVSVEGYELAIPLREDLPQGEYNVTYRVIYSDGHTGEETFSFTNADPNASEGGTPQDGGEATEAETAEADTTNTEAAEDPTDVETQDTLDADEAADETSSASFPGWFWIAGGIGLLVVAGIVFLVLRGRTTAESDESTDDSSM